jgi:hypothetical protein
VLGKVTMEKSENTPETNDLEEIGKIFFSFKKFAKILSPNGKKYTFSLKIHNFLSLTSKFDQIN